jgi:hypothetical protein
VPPTDVEVIVLPRRRLIWRGRTYYPGEALRVSEGELDSFYRATPWDRPVIEATPETAAAIEDAIRRRLPAAGYCVIDDDPDAVVVPSSARARGDSREAAKPPRRTLRPSA